MEYKLILASASPRRHQLMRDAGFEFEVKLKHTEETWPQELASSRVPEYLACLKSDAFDGELNPGELLITADTVVC
ncbi:MAG: Maf family protein, partial [Odoribacter sp.]|nr:Maf family protein [Odoribacter sp.]